MTRARKIKITTTHKRVFRLWQGMLRARCPVCGREVETLSAAQAAMVLEVDAQTLAEFAADRRIHTISTISGSLLVCRDSLFPTQEF